MRALAYMWHRHAAYQVQLQELMALTLISRGPGKGINRLFLKVQRELALYWP
jgi:hypothetical protein